LAQEWLMAKLDPVPREYSPIPRGKRPRDVDQAARARLMQASMFGVSAGLLLGGAGGFMMAYQFGTPMILSIIGGVVLGVVLVMGIALATTEAAGAGAGLVYSAPGGGTRARTDYSRPKALVAHGEYSRAVEEFEAELRSDPTDPQLYLELARLFRDRLDDPERALQCFKRGLRDAELTTGMDILLTREAVELIRKGRLPVGAAAPLLARLAERYPERQEGRWAAKELADIREQMHREHRADDEPPDPEATPW